MLERPTLYFRRRTNGAAVYRVSEGQNARLDMQQIAVLRPNGEVKNQGKHEPTDIELDEIATWHAAREEGVKARDAERVDALIGDLNIVAQWVQADADNDQITSAAQPLLMAMHDLRATLVRRLGGR